tara:strand:- start:17760 stop:18359 length:600 start_codon:yes stop_codon:yes gene_type:complete
MGIIKRAGDLVYTFRFLRLLTTAFEDTAAFKAGIIDKDGKRDKEFTLNTMDNRDTYREAYTPFHRLVFNIKRLIAKAPGGGTKIASYATALYLMREHFSVTDKQLIEALKYADIDSLDFLAENTQWFVLEDKRLSPGLYKVHEHKVLNDTCDELVYPKDKVRVDELCYPVGDVFGLDVYEATHVKTNQTVYVTVGELSR